MTLADGQAPVSPRCFARTDSRAPADQKLDLSWRSGSRLASGTADMGRSSKLTADGEFSIEQQQCPILDFDSVDAG